MSVGTRCTSCAGCAELKAPLADPLAVLRRLPEQLFNVRPPTGDYIPELRAGDTAYDTTIFGPLGQDDATPQYEIARVVAEEKSLFLLNWRTAEAFQLGLGVLGEDENGVVSQCPHASGVDLDRVAAQFGIGRPQGFTDCCYWCLLQLMLWTPGPTTWRLLEIAELYTGIRPSATERPAVITLRWPDVPTSATFWRSGSVDDSDRYYNHDARWTGVSPANPASDSYWRDGDTADVDAFWSQGESRGSFDLEQALAIAKPAGVHVELVNMPIPGSTGCLGATLRGADNGRLGHWT